MSTRSGKRLHNTSNEDIKQNEAELVLKSERKIRGSKRNVENDDGQGVVLKNKKRQNYVSYPADEEVTDTNENEILVVPARALRRNTLREHNAVTEDVELTTHAKKQFRQTRRTKKISENASEDTPEIHHHEKIVEVVTITYGKPKGKKNKKKSEKVTEQAELKNKENDMNKKKNKRKKKSRSNCLVEQQEINDKKKNDMSTDSFHSAAGSPTPVETNTLISPNKTSFSQEGSTFLINVSNSKNKKKSSMRNNSLDIYSPDKEAVDIVINMGKGNSTFDKDNDVIENESRRRKSILKNTTFDKDSQSEPPVKLNSTFEKGLTNDIAKYNIKGKPNTPEVTIESVDIPPPANISNGILNTTFEKDDKTNYKMSKISNITQLINEIPSVNTSHNSTTSVEFKKKSSSSRKSLAVTEQSASLNGTFDWFPEADPTKPKLVDTTFDKESKLDSTFDKTDTRKPTNSKSSLISSDTTSSTINVTLDKSDEMSRISITDDDSKTENILNNTPLLVESSIDESKLESSLKENKTPESQPKPATTPLKREGTFTKEEPEVTMSPQHTPNKRQTLPAAGCTPYHSNGKGSQKKKSVLNLTHSIEKSRRSSLAELAPRMTRVMFCSPVNNPTVVMQQKSKVIKSNLKGSNKSFVYEESESMPPRSGRKRSFTHTEGEVPAGAKRSRVDARSSERLVRLARPRTTSATAKLSATPQKAATPMPKSELKASRLPDFAALHARRFERMESLDECQQRRARRARQLLEPTGSLAVLERSSPRVTIEALRPKATPMRTATPTKAVPKLPTLDTLPRGYTRFGFKLNCDVNPFSIPSKTAEKPKEIKPNGITTLKKQIQPSLAGATSLRRAAAKQTIMREKSFTLAGKRDEKREEFRTVIKGVRTNRRFELQMKLRNVNV